MQVLLTRPKVDSTRIAAELAPLGVTSLIWPLTEINACVDRIDVPAGTEALLFTSANAVRIFAELEPRRDLPALCVGPRSETMARDTGFTEVRGAGGDAADLARLVRNSGLKHLMHPRGRNVAQDIAALIGRPDVELREAVIYQAHSGGPPDPAVEDALQAGSVDLFTIWSARNAALLAGQVTHHPEWPVGGSELLAISASAADPLRDAGFRRIIVAPRPNGTAMIAAIAALMRQKNGSERLC